LLSSVCHPKYLPINIYINAIDLLLKKNIWLFGTQLTRRTREPSDADRPTATTACPPSPPRSSGTEYRRSAVGCPLRCGSAAGSRWADSCTASARWWTRSAPTGEQPVSAALKCRRYWQTPRCTSSICCLFYSGRM